MSPECQLILKGQLMRLLSNQSGNFNKDLLNSYLLRAARYSMLCFLHDTSVRIFLFLDDAL